MNRDLQTDPDVGREINEHCPVTHAASHRSTTPRK